MSYQNKTFDHIFFDFDSTLLQGESLDMLAELCGVGGAVKKLTEESMNGVIPLEDAMKIKMEMICPSLQDIDKIVELCKELIVEDAQKVISAFQLLQKNVYIITSNFEHIIFPLAEILQIKKEFIFANDIYFDKTGKYIGINTISPLLKSQGKLEVLKKLPIQHNLAIMVGDSVGDLACKQAASLFIGFGGVKQRERVASEAEIYISNASLAPLLFHVCNPKEIALLEKNGFEQIIAKAQRLATTTTDTTGGNNSW